MDMGQPRILVVDDNQDVRESLGDLLDAAGFRVTCVEGGKSALAYLRERGGAEATDAILLDFALEDMTGTEFLAERAAQPELARIPVVLVTADSHAAQVAAQEGCECLLKPLEMDDLMASLERQLGALG
jgi:CheY-like chemotaxis protein